MPRKQVPLTEIEVVKKVMRVASRYGFETLNVNDLLNFAEASVEEVNSGSLTRTDLHQLVVGICSAAYKRNLSSATGHLYPSNLLADAFEQANLNVL